jgi:hypothetical protein
MNIVEQLEAIDRPTITAIVRRAVASTYAEVIGWHAEPLGHGETVNNPTTGGVFRVHGQAAHNGFTRPWSVVVKVLRSPAGMTMPGGYVIPPDIAEDATRFSYWRREERAYASGLLDTLGDAVRAPRCWGSLERPDGSVWLWLEQIAPVASEWTAAHYASLARRLGRFNGDNLAPRRAPQAWMSQSWLRSWLDTAIAGYVPFIQDRNLWRHPAMQEAAEHHLQERLLALWDDRHALLDALDHLPHAFAHLDAMRGNVFSRGASEPPVLLDWGFAGMAPVGAELTALVAGTALVDLHETGAIREAERHAERGYLQGLRDSGVEADADAVRFAYAASAALRYAFLAGGTPVMALLDPPSVARSEAQWRQPWSEIVHRRVALATYLLDLAGEATEHLSVEATERLSV